MESTPPKKVKVPTAEHGADGDSFNVADFLAFVVGVSRFIYSLARIRAFQNGPLGLAEWAALSLLAQDESISEKRLGRLMGFPEQRAAQLKSSLLQASLIAEAQSSKDPRHPTVIVTKRGKLHLDDINAVLKPLIEKALKGRPGTLIAAKRQMDLVMRVVAIGSEPRPKKKGTRHKASETSPRG